MRKLPMADRYYLIGNATNTKTHLLYFTHEGGDFLAHQACMPNLLVEVKVGSTCAESYTTDCMPEHASDMDRYYNELTCSTCMKMAQGERQGVLALANL